MDNQVSESGLIGNSINLAGHYVAGRDITITEAKAGQSKPEFIEINLEPYNKLNYLSPSFTDQLIELSKDKRCLIIGGSFGFDKETFVRHLAYLLVEDLKWKCAKEWYFTSDYYNVFSLMQEEKTSTVFILNQISPQNVNYDLSKLISIANERSHIILLSTDIPIEAWRISDNLRSDFWFEIPTTGLYDNPVLSKLLCKLLNQSKDKLKFEKDTIHFNIDTQIVHGLSIDNIAKKLQTPHKIELFVKLLISENETINKDLISEKINIITEGTNLEVLNQWFHTLNEKEKIIALGVVLFDGLYDDQFFSAIHYVIEDYWYLRDNRLKVLDYCDLENILNFYKIEIIDENRKKIKSKFPNQKYDLLKTVWNTHRRHIVLVLPTITKIIRNSVYYPYSNWELFGNDDRKEKLHTVVSETFSLIGIISLPTIEPILIDLASDDEIEVQEVAANAISMWRNYDSKKVFSTLNNWQKETRVHNIFEEKLEKRQEEKEKEDEDNESRQLESKASESIKRKIYARSYIRATIALTLGYSAQYDNPGDLSKEITELLQQLTKDSDELVRERLYETTLPKIIGQHFIQLKDLIFLLTKYPDLIQAIARGLAIAYKSYPEKVLEVIEEWIAYCKKNKRAIQRGHNFTEKARVCVTVILTLGEIDYSIDNEFFDLQTGYSKIVDLQKTFYQNKFRDFYILTIKRQIELHFEKCKTYLPLLIERLSISEQKEIAELFVEMYIDEREGLQNGEDLYLLEGRYIPIWIDNERPLTKIENFMFEWLKNNNEVAQQLATQTFIKFTKVLNFRENEIVEAIKEYNKKIKEAQSEQEESTKDEVIEKKAKPTSFMKLAIAISSIPSADNIRKILGNIVPVALKEKLTNKHYEVIRANWTSKNEYFKDIGHYLQKVFKKYVAIKNVFIVLIVIIIVSFLIYLLSLN